MIEELQMITGSNSNDINYLYYLIIKNGPYVAKFKTIDAIKYEDVAKDKSLEDLFDEL